MDGSITNPVATDKPPVVVDVDMRLVAKVRHPIFLGPFGIGVFLRRLHFFEVPINGISYQLNFRKKADNIRRNFNLISSIFSNLLQKPI
jgi:hypothetical protein